MFATRGKRGRATPQVRRMGRGWGREVAPKRPPSNKREGVCGGRTSSFPQEARGAGGRPGAAPLLQVARGRRPASQGHGCPPNLNKIIAPKGRRRAWAGKQAWLRQDAEHGP
ncbi:hypothetical protein NDU88_004749 [Pleurodeles waltl]|uniref:Uncharacterized protein n=1 Tax=Pleurodeles waltl TaxID=8319 RepID=A0AAV7WVA6_PLEWA|nr:hypothetical protein NDU88_004749 [Pleurodeles waltl]